MVLRLLRRGAAAAALVAAVPAMAGAQLPTLPELVPGVGGVLRPLQPPPRPDRPPPTPLSQCLHPPAAPLLPRGHVTFACDFPDPMVLRVRGHYYAYGTSTGWERGGASFPILESSELSGWRPAGSAFAREPAWTKGHLWAPHVLAARGRYYLYYSALRRRDGVHCVAVATAAQPLGPFRDRGAIACRDRRTAGYIDPAPLVHRGRVFLFFSVDGPTHSLSVLRLRKNLLRARGRRRTVLRVREPWERSAVSETIEAPSPVRRGRRFYLFYSTGCWCLDYRMGYAVARRPLGPYRDGRGNPLLAGTPKLVGPGGGTVFKARGGRPWLAYHAWEGQPAYERGGRRQLRLAPLRWRSGAPRLLAPR